MKRLLSVISSVMLVVLAAVGAYTLRQKYELKRKNN